MPERACRKPDTFTLPQSTTCNELGVDAYRTNSSLSGNNIRSQLPALGRVGIQSSDAAIKYHANVDNADSNGQARVYIFSMPCALQTPTLTANFSRMLMLNVIIAIVYSE